MSDRTSVRQSSVSYSRDTDGLHALVDYLPWLQYLPAWAPGTQFRMDAEKWQKSVVAMYNKPLQFVKRSMVRTLWRNHDKKTHCDYD